MKKKLAKITLMLCVSCALAACGQKGGETHKVTTAASTESDQTYPIVTQPGTTVDENPEIEFEYEDEDSDEKTVKASELGVTYVEAVSGSFDASRFPGYLELVADEYLLPADLNADTINSWDFLYEEVSLYDNDPEEELENVDWNTVCNTSLKPGGRARISGSDMRYDNGADPFIPIGTAPDYIEIENITEDEKTIGELIKEKYYSVRLDSDLAIYRMVDTEEDLQDHERLLLALGSPTTIFQEEEGDETCYWIYEYEDYVIVSQIDDYSLLDSVESNNAYCDNITLFGKSTWEEDEKSSYYDRIFYLRVVKD